MSFLNISLKLRIFIAVIIYLLWVASFTYFNFSQEKDELSKTLENAALITSLILPKTLHHQNMHASDLTREQDYNNTLQLSKFTDSTDLVYIYTLILRDSKIYFSSSSSTIEERQEGKSLTPYFLHYDDVDPAVYNIFNSKEITYIDYTDQWGSFRSVFVPTYSSDGTLYLAAADISISHIQALFNKQALRSVIVATLFLLFVYPFYLAIACRLKSKANQLDKTVHHQTSALLKNEKRLNTAMNTAQQSWFDLNIQTGEIHVSKEYSRLLKYKPADSEMDFTKWQEHIHPEDKQATLSLFKDCLKTGGPTTAEYRIKAKDGGWPWLHSVGEIIEWDDNNNPTRMVGIHRNVTERKRSELVLQALAETGTSENTDIFRTIVRQLALSHNTRYAFIACINENDNTQADIIALWADGDFAENFSYSLLGTPCANILDEDETIDFWPEHIQQQFPDDHLLVEMEAESYIGAVLKDHTGNTIGLISLIDDKPMSNHLATIDLLKSLAVRTSIEINRQATEEKLQLSTRVFRDTHEGIIIMDANGFVIDVNPAFHAITGFSHDDIIGQHSHQLRSDKHPTEFYDDLWKTTNQQGYWQGEVWNSKKNGDVFPALYTISLLRDDDEVALNYVILFTDITESKHQQQTLESIAHYDVLTQLPNRTLFADRFAQAAAQSNRSDTMFAVCFLDLDNFKPVNDNYGHDVGDQLLIEVAERIQANIREEDTVSRQGGDEFTLLLRDVDSFAHCELMVQRIHQSLSQPYIIDGHHHHISTSTGITLYPLDDADLDTLLRHADQAMYQAKLAGKNHYKLYNALNDQQTIHKQSRLQEIKQALLNDEFVLYYQPKVNMKTGEIFGAEALIRWQHPEKGLIPPFDFLPIIENTDLEIQVGNWVINQALTQMNVWFTQDIALEISVNISSHHLQSPLFHDQLDEALAQYPRIDSKYFQLEILESSALGDLTTISNVVKSCRHTLGVNIALDDFGTGYSSLTHLRNLAAQTIKIDRSFVKDILDDPNDFAIIKGVIGLANSFNRGVIAEGVETTEHGLMLLALGCEQAQGFGIARPMPADDIQQWLKSYTHNPEWIECAQKNLGVKDQRIKLFNLVSTQWIQAFSKNIQSPTEDVEFWPIMTETKCHCGHWIKQARQKRLFKKEFLDALESSHQTMHQIALDLLVTYQAGEIGMARGGLKDVQTAFDKMSDTVNSLNTP